MNGDGDCVRCVVCCVCVACLASLPLTSLLGRRVIIILWNSINDVCLAWRGSPLAIRFQSRISSQVVSKQPSLTVSHFVSPLLRLVFVLTVFAFVATLFFFFVAGATGR